MKFDTFLILVKYVIQCFPTGSRPSVLQKTEVTVVTNEECNSWYRSQGSKVKVIGTQMCAGYEDGGRDSCWVSDSN